MASAAAGVAARQGRGDGFGRQYGRASFPLKGSGAAIGKVLAECGKGSGGEAD
ncbi:hypothetical protein [Mesorhizobium argentiipisi]|uniref:Uncharacterized protein n=1 Tax=Mesorhizobium argentiipisi TaxID=3015175 RepID=A0ABU8KLR5_9HYPH